MKDVRILLVGDRGTGKTSLVLAVVKERFEAQVPPKAEEVVIPPDITAARVATYVVDSSLRVQDEEEIEEEIRKASVVCIVYAVDDQASFARITGHWLPVIRRTLAAAEGRTRVPVILVGNKVDTRTEDDASARSLETETVPIMNEFPEVETCIECSAKRVMNISELIAFAQKAVLYPSAPLYDSLSHSLTPGAVAALARVFRLCDVDKDGLLNDTELLAFQATCFASPLPAGELAGLKEVVSSNCADGMRNGALTCSGFVHLNRLFIERGHIETTWTVLRRYGYQDDLTLHPDFIHPPLGLGMDTPVELSAAGEAFLRDLFRRLDKNASGVLAADQLHELWATAPAGDPWEEFAMAPGPDGRAGITLDRFLNLWTLLALDSPRLAVEYFACLGYRTFAEQGGPASSAASAITVGRSRRVDREAGYTTRSVFLVYVFGQENSGKSTLLDRAGSHTLVHTPLSGHKTAMVAVPGATPVTLVLREFAVPGADADVLSSPTLRDQCDLALFLYDTSDPTSFGYIAGLHSKMVPNGPACLFAATKADLKPQTQDYAESPTEYCARRGLPSPLPVREIGPLLAAAADLCLHPRSGLAAPAEPSAVRRLATAVVLLGAVAGIAFGVARFIRLRK